MDRAWEECRQLVATRIKFAGDAPLFLLYDCLQKQKLQLPYDRLSAKQWQALVEDRDMLETWLLSLFAFQEGGPLWKNYNRAMKKSLYHSQQADGKWENPLKKNSLQALNLKKQSHWPTTALASLTLSIYYRYLPMVKLEAGKKTWKQEKEKDDDIRGLVIE